MKLQQQQQLSEMAMAKEYSSALLVLKPHIALPYGFVLSIYTPFLASVYAIPSHRSDVQCRRCSAEYDVLKSQRTHPLPVHAVMPL